MQANSSGAVSAKARGMYARHISPNEYEEMLRRRSVPELALRLKKHAYFGNSLATLSVAQPRRGQIEELLSMDVFLKYGTLCRYARHSGGFSDYYLEECELREVLKALQLLSIGLQGAYLTQVPPYLADKTHIDLFELGKAQSFKELLSVCHGAPYYKTLREQYAKDPTLSDFPLTEAALLRGNYARLFHHISETLGSGGQKQAHAFFAHQAEIYNLELFLRVKMYYASVYPPEKLRLLMLPYRYRLSANQLNAMIFAKTSDALLSMYKNFRSVKYTGPADADIFSAEMGKNIYHHAKQLLHLSPCPMTVLAAFVTLAKLERENVVNIVEGVRYGLAPEKMRKMLRF